VCNSENLIIYFVYGVCVIDGIFWNKCLDWREGLILSGSLFVGFFLGLSLTHIVDFDWCN